VLAELERKDLLDGAVGLGDGPGGVEGGDGLGLVRISRQR
jgi:hypothetical protein